MKAVIVDDENLALLKLEKLLRAINVPLEVIGTFFSPYEALTAAVKMYLTSPFWISNCRRFRGLS